MFPTYDAVLYLPVLVWIGTGAGLVYAFRTAEPTVVLRLASAFLALWSLLATTSLAWVLANGGWGALAGIARTPGGVLTIFSFSDAPLWLYGAAGAFGVLLVAFFVNQAVGRGILYLMGPVAIPWPDGLERPVLPVLLFESRSVAREAFSFTLVTFGGPRRRPHRLEVIVLSKGLVDVLAKEELASVVAHEVGHLRGLDGRYLTFLRTLSRLMRWDPVLAYIAAKVTSREEYRADDDAVRSTGRPLALARALYKASIEPPARSSFGIAGFLGAGGTRGRREALARIRRLVAMAERRREPEVPGG
ncbi:MAG: M56 family metallopeptidase [Thermoplasmata archaeon]|nr:M56 family metallopeptidase [Thermoplasmata archaeon]MCI4358967.1 M56 family metallopeptidase [Thermoplasmata archaeon]